MEEPSFHSVDWKILRLIYKVYFFWTTNLVMDALHCLSSSFWFVATQVSVPGCNYSGVLIAWYYENKIQFRQKELNVFRCFPLLFTTLILWILMQDGNAVFTYLLLANKQAHCRRRKTWRLRENHRLCLVTKYLNICHGQPFHQ